MSNVVTVACNLPTGFCVEVGLQLDYALGRFIRTPAYRRVLLRGSQYATIVALPKGSRYIPQRDLSPGLTEGVDRDVIEQWLREHPKMSTHIWIVDSPKDLKHQVGDRPAAPFQPLDPTKKMKFGGADTVETADHDPLVANKS